MKTIIGVYKITSLHGKVYIGQSINILKRFDGYLKLNNCQGQHKLRNSFQKYRVESHQFEIIEECLENQLNERERYWQDYYDVLGINGLNLILTKTNSKSGKLSREVCEKKSKSMKGKFIRRGVILSENTKQLMSLAAEGKSKPWLKGRKCPKPNKIILQYDLQGNFIKEWESAKVASGSLNKTKSNITAVANGSKKIAYNFKWKYK